MQAPRWGFGGAPIGNLFAAVESSAAAALVRHAFDRGIRYFDTAPHYGNGLSERRVGAGLRGIDRDAYVLSSKVGRILIADSRAPSEQNSYVDVMPFRQRWDYSRDGALRSIDDSLARLGTSRLDVVYIHDIDRRTHGSHQPERFREAMNGAAIALTELRDQRVIGGFGLGVNDVQVCIDTLQRIDLDVVLLAGRYTLLDQSASTELFPLCQRRGVGIVVGGPFNSGILATGSRPPDGSTAYYDYGPATPETLTRVERIEAHCRTFDVPLAAAALQFPRAHSAVTGVVAGARSTREVDQNLDLAGRPIPAAFWAKLRRDGLISDDVPVPKA
jgi:D-threo-aldose 1-dehydrogenase